MGGPSKADRNSITNCCDNVMKPESLGWKWDHYTSHHGNAPFSELSVFLLSPAPPQDRFYKKT